MYFYLTKKTINWSGTYVVSANVQFTLAYLLSLVVVFLFGLISHTAIVSLAVAAVASSYIFAVPVLSNIIRFSSVLAHRLFGGLTDHGKPYILPPLFLIGFAIAFVLDLVSLPLVLLGGGMPKAI